MANPNIVNVTDIKGRTAVANIITSATTLVENSAASNKVFKINGLIISNIDGTLEAGISVDIYRENVPYYIVRTVSVPADSSLDILSKPLYLEEGDSLRTLGSSNSILQAVCSYEEIS